MAFHVISGIGNVGSNLFSCSASRGILHTIGKNSMKKNLIRHFKRTRNEIKEIERDGNLETPFTHFRFSENAMSFKNLWKPFGFTVAFSGTCFVGATIWQYENMRAHAISIMKQPIGWFQKKVRSPKVGTWRREINTWWNNLTSAEKLFLPLCGLNILVFLAWRVPQLQPTMMKYFCSNPASTVICWPMILSTFSHYSGFHLLANMYVLHSFSTGAVEKLGKEQFLALYLSAGVVSSFTSYIHKVLTKQPGLSLGASGAIMAILGYVCVQFPDTKLGIIFLPFFTFPAEAAIKVIIGLDLMGLLLGWKLFDHAAHLGGAALGIAWTCWGHENLWQKRDFILQYWHNLRGPPTR